MRKISEDKINNIRELRRGGLSLEKISKEMDLSRDTVTKYTKDIVLNKEEKYLMISKSLQKYNYNLSTFTDVSASTFYILGAFITDGHILYNEERHVYAAILTSKDLDWLESINALISPNKPIVKAKESKAYLLKIHNKKIADWFIRHNCKPRKSLDVKFPNIPKEYLIDFIRGCMDGDGCFCIYKAKDKKNPQFYSYISSASYSFIEEFQSNLKRLGIKSTINKCNLVNSVIKGRAVIAKHNLFRLHFCRSETVKLIKTIYYKNCLCLVRKQNKCKEILQLSDNESAMTIK